MLGAIAGDVIGSIYEWNNHRSTVFPLFSPGSSLTDDSILTVALAEAILDDGNYAMLLRRYGALYPDAGYGGRFYRWLFDPSLGPYGSFGNGAAMRVSPAGWAYATLEETLRKAEVYTAVTHNHPEGIKEGQVVAGAIWMGRHGVSKAEIRRWIEGHSGDDLSRSCDEIRPAYQFDESCQGTVPQAVTAFLESADFEGAIRLAVSLGGDTDTLACITGSMAEAFYGGVPAEIERETMSRLHAPMRDVVVRFRERFGCRRV